ncbi:MAG: nitroreductase family protein [Coriobacteriia bacterium]|nr:nitroreductase family protein [Coriobacteriia bacterium]
MTQGSGLTLAQAARWHAAIDRRRSRRSYDETRLDPADLDALEALAESFRPFAGARVGLVREASSDMFVGIVGAYGGVSGAPSAFVLLGRADTPPQTVGYTGEALMLEATARDLDTCWVGGMFSSVHAARSAGASPAERVFGVSPVGRAHDTVTLKERVLFKGGRPRRRMSVEEIAPGSGSWPEWARAAAEAVVPAPSAMNRQPWRLRFEGAALVISFDGKDTPRISKRLDCGIAMLHAELAVASYGVEGSWETLPSPDVARFVPGV